jgi:hypothetical protein
MNTSFSTVLGLRLLHGFEWIKPIVEKFCSAVALEVAMLKRAWWQSSGAQAIHIHPPTSTPVGSLNLSARPCSGMTSYSSVGMR